MRKSAFGHYTDRNHPFGHQEEENIEVPSVKASAEATDFPYKCAAEDDSFMS